MAINIYDIMLSPIRVRIIQAVATKDSITTTEIGRKLNDISRTTLYRQINILINAGVLRIIEEKKIRGSLERTLALNIEKITEQNTIGNKSQQAFRFLMNTYVKFEKYFNKENIEKNEEILFLNNTVMMMDDQEFDNFSLDLKSLLLKYNFNVAQGRKPRDISIISAPVESDNENE